MPLRDIDRQLIDRCLRHEPGAWNDFVDRYLGSDGVLRDEVVPG